MSRIIDPRVYNCTYFTSPSILRARIYVKTCGFMVRNAARDNNDCSFSRGGYDDRLGRQ